MAIRRRCWGYGPLPSTTYLIDLPTDGSDVSAALAAELADVPDGFTIRPTTAVLPAGTFRVDTAALKVYDRGHLRVGGLEGAVFSAFSDLDMVDLGLTSQMGIDLLRCTDVVVSWVDWRGPNDEDDDNNPGYARYVEAKVNSHAFSFRNHNVDCGIENCNASDVYGDGIYVGFSGGGVERNTNVWVKNCTVNRPGRQAMGIVYVDGLLVEDVDIDWAGRSGIDVEPVGADDHVANATFRRVQVGSQFNPVAIVGSLKAYPQRENLWFDEVSVIRCASEHPFLFNSRSPNAGFLKVTNCTDLRQSSIYGINISVTWPTLVVSGNTIVCGTHTPTSYAVRFGATESVTITDNAFDSLGAGEGFDELYLDHLGALPPEAVISGNTKDGAPFGP